MTSDERAFRVALRDAVAKATECHGIQLAFADFLQERFETTGNERDRLEARAARAEWRLFSERRRQRLFEWVTVHVVTTWMIQGDLAEPPHLDCINRGWILGFSACELRLQRLSSGAAAVSAHFLREPNGWDPDKVRDFDESCDPVGFLSLWR